MGSSDLFGSFKDLLKYGSALSKMEVTVEDGPFLFRLYWRNRLYKALYEDLKKDEGAEVVLPATSSDSSPTNQKFGLSNTDQLLLMIPNSNSKGSILLLLGRLGNLLSADFEVFQDSRTIPLQRQFQKLESQIKRAISLIKKIPADSLSEALSRDITAVSFNILSLLERVTLAGKYIATNKQKKLSQSGFGEDLEIDNLKLNQAEGSIASYFGLRTVMSPPGISREGAGRFQGQVLHDLFRVSSVGRLYGAVLYYGSIASSSTTSEEFLSRLDERLKSTGYGEEVAYIYLPSEFSANFSDFSISKAVMDELIGSSPVLVVHPKTWKIRAVVDKEDPVINGWVNVFYAFSYASSLYFAFIACQMLDPAGPLLLEHRVPDDFLNLAFGPILIQTVAGFVEKVVAAKRGIVTAFTQLPGLIVPTNGFRTSYLSTPKNRIDVFDPSAAGVLSGMVLSLGSLYYGLKLTAAIGTTAALSALPQVPLSLLQANGVVSQFVNFQLPNLFRLLEANPQATVHMHWLAITGAVSFIAQTLQLFPIDNSAGARIASAALGLQSGLQLTVFMTAVRFLYIIALVISSFTAADSDWPTAVKLTVDYFVCSQLVFQRTVRFISLHRLFSSPLSSPRHSVVLSFLLRPNDC